LFSSSYMIYVKLIGGTPRSIERLYKRSNKVFSECVSSAVIKRKILSGVWTVVSEVLQFLEREILFILEERGVTKDKLEDAIMISDSIAICPISNEIGEMLEEYYKFKDKIIKSFYAPSKKEHERVRSVLMTLESLRIFSLMKDRDISTISNKLRSVRVIDEI